MMQSAFMFGRQRVFEDSRPDIHQSHSQTKRSWGSYHIVSMLSRYISVVDQGSPMMSPSMSTYLLFARTDPGRGKKSQACDVRPKA